MDELVLRDGTPEAFSKLRPQVLVRLYIAVDDVEGLVSRTGLERSPKTEVSVQLGVSEACASMVEVVAAGPRKRARELLVDGGVEAKRGAQVHEVVFGKADHVVRIGNDPVP